MACCIRCDRPATLEVTWPFNGMVEPYCDACMDEYHAGADEIDRHEMQLCAEGLPGYACPRPSERRLDMTRAGNMMEARAVLQGPSETLNPLQGAPTAVVTD